MFLKAFKQKSKQKYINKLLNSRRLEFKQGKIKNVGIILNLKEFDQFEAFLTFFKSLEIQDNKISVLAFVENDKQVNPLWGNYFSSKDFGWKGKLKNIELKNFLDNEFDILISFYKQNVLELNLVTAKSKANFKVGLSGLDNRLYDLILDVDTNDFKLFKSELTKYLTVLNKI